MSLCVRCGLDLIKSNEEICGTCLANHDYCDIQSMRAMCDLIHRGKITVISRGITELTDIGPTEIVE